MKQIFQGITFPSGVALYDPEHYVAKCQIVDALFTDNLKIIKYYLHFDFVKLFELLDLILRDNSLFEEKKVRRAQNEEEENSALDYKKRLAGLGVVTSSIFGDGGQRSNIFISS